MTATQSEPIACTLPSGEFSERMVWIADLNRASLLQHHHQDLRLELVYARDATAQVHDLVRREQQCCAFLTFTIREDADGVRLLIEAPESARAAATELFEQFRAKEPTGAGCACATRASSVTPMGTVSRFRNVAVKSSAAAALACGVCCVLPFALPAVAVTAFGSVFAAFAGVYWWALGIAVATVAIGWLWVVWQGARTRKKPAKTTLLAMSIATVVLGGAASWSLAEPHIIALLTR